MTAKLMTPDQTTFESEVCSRCGGTGRHSFNQMDRDVCYGCGGSGCKLTKRGAEAQRFFREMMLREAKDLKVGDVVKYTGVTVGGRTTYTAWAPVVELDLEEKVTSWTIRAGERIPIPSIEYVTDHSKLGRCGHRCQPTSKVQIKGSPEERQAAIAKALNYQATLTKTGQPRKAGR